MRGMANTTVTWSDATDVSMGANATSDPIRVENLSSFAVQMSWSGGGSPAGTLKLQMSNDLGQERNDAGSAPTVWTDVASSSQAVSADGDHAWTVALPGYRWVRVVWTRSSGTGTLTGRFNGKG